MLKYLICIFVILVNMSILSYLQDTRGCIFYLVSKILFESIFPNPATSTVTKFSGAECSSAPENISSIDPLPLVIAIIAQVI